MPRWRHFKGTILESKCLRYSLRNKQTNKMQNIGYLGCCANAKSLQLFPTLCGPMGCKPTRLLCLWNSPDKNTGVGSLSLLERIFLTYGSNPGLLHCRQIFYHLSQGNKWAEAKLIHRIFQNSKDTFWTFQSSGLFWVMDLSTLPTSPRCELFLCRSTTKDDSDRDKLCCK